MADHSPSTSSGGRTHRAGLFDIRIIIGSLVGIYGVILVLMGIFGSSTTKHKADDVNVNLWAGLAMLVAAIVFAVWTRLRPIVVPEEVPQDDDRPAGH